MQESQELPAPKQQQQIKEINMGDFDFLDAGMVAGAQEQETKDFEPLPNGAYVAQIEACRVETSQTGKQMLNWEMRIASGQYAGRMVWKNNMLQTPENLNWLVTDLKSAGCPVLAKTPAGIETARNQLINKIVKIRVKNSPKSNFPDVYVQGTLKPEEEVKVIQEMQAREKASTGTETGTFPDVGSDIPF